MNKAEIVSTLKEKFNDDLLVALENDSFREEAKKLSEDDFEELINDELRRNGLVINPSEGELFIGDYEYRMSIMNSSINELRKRIVDTLNK